MGRYELRVHSQDRTINYKVPIDSKTGMINKSHMTKNDLFCIDLFTARNNEYFSNQKSFLEYLKQYDFYVSDDMTPYISYQSNGKEQVLQVIYQADEELKEFINIFSFLSEQKLNEEGRKNIL